MCAMLNADLAAGAGNNSDHGFIARHAIGSYAMVRGGHHNMRFSWSAGQADTGSELHETGVEG